MSKGKQAGSHDSVMASAGESERVQKALARMGFGSRREIERLIEAGKIRINGQLASPGDHVSAGDKVNVGSKSVVITAEVRRIRVLLYNKPEGEVCTRQDEKGRPTVFDRIGRISDGRWITVGRLDINSTGLLLFTNYGALANHLMHPSSEVEREYAVRVQGEVTPQIIRNLLKGVELEDGVSRFDQVIDAGGQGSNHWYHVILREGKNREVRRLWQSQDVRVSRLIRVRYANISLPRDLKPGRKVELSLEEVKQLFSVVDMPWPQLGQDNEKRANAKRKSASKDRRFSGHSKNLRKAGRSVQSRKK